MRVLRDLGFHLRIWQKDVSRFFGRKISRGSVFVQFQAQFSFGLDLQAVGYAEKVRAVLASFLDADRFSIRVHRQRSCEELNLHDISSLKAVHWRPFISFEPCSVSRKPSCLNKQTPNSSLQPNAARPSALPLKPRCFRSFTSDSGEPANRTQRILPHPPRISTYLALLASLPSESYPQRHPEC